MHRGSLGLTGEDVVPHGVDEEDMESSTDSCEDHDVLSVPNTSWWDRCPDGRAMSSVDNWYVKIIFLAVNFIFNIYSCCWRVNK